MATAMRLGLAGRLIVLAINVLSAYCVFALSLGRLVPTGGLDSIWLLSAISVWLLTLVSAPWFEPPRDIIVSAIGSAILLLSIPLGSEEGVSASWNAIRWGGVALVVFGAGLSVASIATLQFGLTETSKWLFRAATVISPGRLLFSIPAILAIFLLHQNQPAVLFWVLAYWLIFVVSDGVRKVGDLLVSLQRLRMEGEPASQIGTLYRIDDPDVVRVRVAKRDTWDASTSIRVTTPDGTELKCLPLYAQVLGSNTIGTALTYETNEKSAYQKGSVVRDHAPANKQMIVDRISGEEGCSIAGFTVENSRIETINFEVDISTPLREGDVIFANIEGQRVFYQIIDASTGEEAFEANPYGKQIASATQLGTHDANRGFEKFSWLPKMNTPLFKRTLETKAAEEVEGPPEGWFELGRVPTTNLPAFGEISSMVDHHTAILGATGTGKTEVALDFIQNALANDTKVVCVDLTGEYRHRLSDHKITDLGPTSKQSEELEDRLFDVETGKYGAGDEKKALQEEIDKLSGGIDGEVAKFLEADDEQLAIFELAEITNTKATLRLTELYLSAVMMWARKNRQARRILIVLEEAHTIVPEASGSGFDFSTQSVVSKIGQIALQGRKYGVGLLVVTQRTALVSKTILSQCNTFITHSLIDQTSLGFLTNVYSQQHCKAIPNLERFHFIASGKGVSSQRPILLRRDFDPNIKAASDALKAKLEKKLDPEPVIKEAT